MSTKKMVVVRGFEPHPTSIVSLPRLFRIHFSFGASSQHGCFPASDCAADLIQSHTNFTTVKVSPLLREHFYRSRI